MRRDERSVLDARSCLAAGAIRACRRRLSASVLGSQKLPDPADELSVKPSKIPRNGDCDLRDLQYAIDPQL